MGNVCHVCGKVASVCTEPVKPLPEHHLCWTHWNEIAPKQWLVHIMGFGIPNRIYWGCTGITGYKKVFWEIWRSDK